MTSSYKMNDSKVKEIKIDDDLRLRPFAESDAETVLESVSRNYEHLRTFMEWAKPDYSISDAREFVTKAVSEASQNKSLNFGIYRADKFIGTIGFVEFDHDAKVTEIGYWIDKDEEGKGIVVTACGLLLDLAFTKLGMNRVQIRCVAANTRSLAIPERLGFVKEGVQRQHVIRNGAIFDFLIYGLLAAEWKLRSKI